MINLLRRVFRHTAQEGSTEQECPYMSMHDMFILINPLWHWYFDNLWNVVIISIIDLTTSGKAPKMVITPRKHTPIEGIIPICRYLAREYCPDLFPESTNPLLASQIDSSLDSFSFSYLNGNAKEKASVLRHMNSSLGSSPYLVGTTPTLADVVYFATLVSQSGLKLGGNVKDWMKRCHTLQWCNFL